ncbi:SDR family oxidoreductase [Streptomyces sp. NPDC052127]|uniref:SDR family oxidoreductase n=1 Tax=Streptomyces sp. NPDC052127 TaxID=3155679 RepID=UPI00342D89E7
MKVVVFDGGGPTAAQTAQRVKDHGHEVAVVSASTGADALTGVGLADTLTGCSVVIDLSGPPSLDDGTLTEEDGLVIDEDAVLARVGHSTADLLAAEAAVGVEHHVSLSVVGVERVREEGAFRALQAQEEMIRRSGIPYSIVRATQLFESVEEIATAATQDWIVWVPPVEVRPVACAEVATLLAHTAAFKPWNSAREIAGPEQFRLDTFVRVALAADAADQEHRRVFTDDRSTLFGARIRRTDLLPGPGAHIAQQRYGDWLADRRVPEATMP